MKLKLGYLMLSAAMFTTVVSYAQPAKASSYTAVGRAIGNLISNPTLIGGLIVVILLGLVVIKNAR